METAGSSRPYSESTGAGAIRRIQTVGMGREMGGDVFNSYTVGFESKWLRRPAVGRRFQYPWRLGHFTP